MNALLALIEHTEDCDKFTGAGTACTCGADKAKDVYTELVNDNASLRARVGEQQTQAKIDVLNELLQEIDETVYVETWGYIEQKRDELSAALAKGAK